MGHVEEAEKYLRVIGELSEILAGEQALYEAEIKKIGDKYEALVGDLAAEIKEHEKSLVKLMKKHKGDFFDDTDQVDLENGILLYGKEDKVSIPKTARAIIEKLKWEDGLKRVVTVNREAVEKWPLEKLVAIGAERKPKETFSYELKPEVGGRRSEVGDDRD